MKYATEIGHCAALNSEPTIVIIFWYKMLGKPGKLNLDMAKFQKVLEHT